MIIRLLILLPVVVALMFGTLSAFAQLSGVKFDVDRAGGFVGLGGFARVGHWTPIRVTLENQSAELREVKVQWLLEDEDGDRVVAERLATLNPMRSDIHVWLYATPTMATRPHDPNWKIQVVDAETGRGLGEPLKVFPDPTRFLSPQLNAIGMMSSITLGLDDLAQGATTHERTKLATGLRLTDLPDRWFGLSAFNTLIWTHGDGEGGDPNDPAFTPDMQDALRQWAKRGGHLVIVLPAYGEPWTGSKLSDILPVGAGQMRRIEAIPPSDLLGTTLGAERAPIAMTVFDLAPNSDAEVIARDRGGNVLAVGKRYGFGRVTLVGVDLADRGLVRMGLPNGKWTIWHKVFGWLSPAFTQTQVDAQIRNQHMVRPDVRHRAPVLIGPGWLPGIIDMTGTATPALLLSIIVFIIYWLVAGPGVFAVLKAKGWHRHAWVAFVAIVGVFTAITWGGAYLFREGKVTVAHFSVLDMDGNTGQTHSRGWLSLFTPQFGLADVAIDPDHPDHFNTLASPGVISKADAGRFPDQQVYTINSGSPTHAPVPVRATTKRFIYDYAGRLDDDREGLTEPWVGPSGALKIEQGWPVGKLMHGLPAPISEMMVVYCPGDEKPPWVWRINGQWPAGTPLDIARPNTRFPRLYQSRSDYPKDRDFGAEGYLGNLIARKTAAGSINKNLMPGGSGLRRDLMQQLEMLSFFDALPPPHFRETDAGFAAGFGDTTKTYHRQFGRELDMTPLTTGKRLILIGYVKGAPLPAPLTVDGRAVPEVSDNSVTVVRWVYDFE